VKNETLLNQQFRESPAPPSITMELTLIL